MGSSPTTRMKKKPKRNSPAAAYVKGNKLPYAKLRQLVLDMILQDANREWSARQIIKKLKLGNSKTDVTRVLESLVKQGKINSSGDGLYAGKGGSKKLRTKADGEHISKKNLFEGRVDLTRSGAAYIITDALEDDIYVPAKHTQGAMHRDIVEVEIVSKGRGRKMEGRIVHIKKRALEQVIGTLRKYKQFAVVVPDKATIPFDILVAKEHEYEAVDGDKVVVKIIDWDSASPTGQVTHVLGSTGSHELEMQSILIHNGFNPAWPPDVIEEALGLPEKISDQEIEKRRDFRQITTFTIDPVNAKDFDDALSIRTLKNGNLEIGVHIADVSHYVKAGSVIDKEAYQRSTSVYLVDRVCPMLPEKLSNELCSLRPKEESLCYSAVFEMDNDYKIVDRWFGRTVIYSDHRFSYEEAQEVMDAGEGLYVDELKQLNKIAKLYRKQRFRKGAINFETDELQFLVDEGGETLEIFVKERKEAHLLIEEFMLLANREVAEYMTKKSKGKEIPFVYRVHDVPDPDKLAEFQRFAKELGFHMQIDTPKQIAKSFNKLADEANKNPALRLLEPLAIRTMAKAVYTTRNIGHYGLAFEDYTHFTSPIRRYSDVLVHRILDANLGEQPHREDKEKLETRCKHISDMERAAMAAERESVKYKQLEYLQNRIGREFTGKINGVIESGIFVELDESRAEGLVPFKTMPGSFHQTTPFKAGSRRGIEFHIGQPVTVRITSIDLSKRQMDLELVMEVN